VTHLTGRRDLDAVNAAASAEKDKSLTDHMLCLPSVWECSEHLRALKLHQILMVQELNRT